MNLNTICLRIFCVLFLLLVGGCAIVAYGAKTLAPLAVYLLPTERVRAHFIGPIMVELSMNSPEQRSHAEIEYAGHTATLLTTSPLELVPREENGIMDFDPPIIYVRYVRMFPRFVIREVPRDSLWAYYGEIWMTREVVAAVVCSGAFILVGWFFFRHLRRSREQPGW